jgi:hypothetical protein
VVFSKINLVSSHPETTLPDENIQLPAIIYGQKPFKKGFLARVSWSNQGVSIRKFEFPEGNELGLLRHQTFKQRFSSKIGLAGYN